ncbi:hypothetical protein MASR2M15_03410 [Anaerolineales bacterium]
MDIKENQIVVYGTVTCPMVPPVKALLGRSKIPYEYIDIHKNEEGRALVRELNQGFESVPTITFTDGSFLSEPSIRELGKKLEALGYEVSMVGRLLANLPYLILGAIILFAILRFIEVI